MLTHQSKKDSGHDHKGAPSVINELLIRESIKQYNEENKIWNQNDIHFSKVTHLHLSFKNIQGISNLQGFSSLLQLKLNYNNLERISGIDHLLNLRWLGINNLSFNYIKNIEGLDNLLNLKDLSLFHNQINDISGLPVTLRSLDILSIGANPIPSYDPVILHLRKFKKLQCLNVAGCQFTTSPNSEYKKAIRGALAPMLKYIDYEFIDEDMRKKDREDFQKGAIAQIFDQDPEGESEEIQIAKKQKELDQKEALVFSLNVFTINIANYEEIQKILENLPGTGMEEIIQQALKDTRDEENILGIIQNLQEWVIQENKKKLNIVNMFREALQERFLEAENITISELDKFIDKKDKVFNQIDGPLSKHNEGQLNELEKRLEKLNDKLMLIELDMTQSIDDMFENYFKNDLKTQNDVITEEISDKFGVIGERLEEMYNKIDHKIFQELMPIFDKQMNEEDEEGESEEEESSGAQNLDQTEDREGLLSNKAMTFLEEGDDISQLLGTLQEKLLAEHQKISNSLVKDFNVEMKQLFANFKDETYTRNRQNINNIITYLTKYKEEIMEMRDKGDDDDSYSDMG